MAMKGVVKWVGDAMFVAESASGHSVVIDGPPEGGGRNMGVRPMELVLLGTGGCSAYDVVHILKKARQDVRGCRVELDAERADSPPQVFTKIHMRFIVSGKGLPAAQVERAVQLSAEKYCSASIMLAKTATITHEFVVEEVE
jgi:putative redox protein